MIDNIFWAVQTDESGLKTYRKTDENGQVWWVPEAPGNRHYAEYLAWVAEGNTAEEISE